jgi:hypothetical protein
VTDAWLRDRADEFIAMRGRVVRGWYGIEMAVREGGDGPEFGGPDVPCLQLVVLNAQLAGGPALAVHTYQNDCECGLILAPPIDAGPYQDGIYRARSLPELPVGPVDEVAVRVDGGVLAEVLLRIGRRDLLLVAGEAYEDSDGGLSWHRFDESVLAFTEPTAAEALTWAPPREAAWRPRDASWAQRRSASRVARDDTCG